MNNKILVSKSQSVPKLPSITSLQSKLFQNNESLSEAKTAFLSLIRSKSEKREQEQDNKVANRKRSLIQLPKIGNKEGFISFSSINQNETNQILDNLSKLRSKSTMVKSYIKAQIVSNQNQIEKIIEQNQKRKQQQKQFIKRKLKQMTPSKMNKQVKIKQKFKNKVKVVTQIHLSMDFSIYQANLQAWKPYIDYDSVVVNHQKDFYLLGGRKDVPIVKYSASKNHWILLDDKIKLKPFGDTQGTVFQDKKTKKWFIIFFGGNFYYQPNFTQINNSMRIIDIQGNTVQTREFIQNKVPHRAYHSQCQYGKYLIISGGINKDNRHFSNFMNYSYQQKFWSELVVNKRPNQLQIGFAKHCTLAIFHTRKNYSIYDQQPITKYDPNIQIQGIYIYGGQNSRGGLNSKIFIMKLGSPSIEIIEPQTKGSTPIARRNTKMVKSKQFLIIHGGRNDQMKPFVLNSMHFLNLKTFDWIKVEGQKPPYRFSHAINANNQQIIILGGKGVQGLTKQVFIMQYNPKIQYR